MSGLIGGSSLFGSDPLLGATIDRSALTLGGLLNPGISAASVGVGGISSPTGILAQALLNPLDSLGSAWQGLLSGGTTASVDASLEGDLSSLNSLDGEIAAKNLESGSALSGSGSLATLESELGGGSLATLESELGVGTSGAGSLGSGYLQSEFDSDLAGLGLDGIPDLNLGLNSTAMLNMDGSTGNATGMTSANGASDAAASLAALEKELGFSTGSGSFGQNLLQNEFIGDLSELDLGGLDGLMAGNGAAMMDMNGTAMTAANSTAANATGGYSAGSLQSLESELGISTGASTFGSNFLTSEFDADLSNLNLGDMNAMSMNSTGTTPTT